MTGEVLNIKSVLGPLAKNFSIHSPLYDVIFSTLPFLQRLSEYEPVNWFEWYIWAPNDWNKSDGHDEPELLWVPEGDARFWYTQRKEAGASFVAICQEVIGFTEQPRLGANWIMQWSDPFSDDWYCAAIAKEVHSLLTSEQPAGAPASSYVINRTFQIGKLVAERHWRTNHFNASQLGGRNEVARTRAGIAKERVAAETHANRMTCLARLFDQAETENGTEFMRRDQNAAYAILALAEKSPPPELVLKSTGKLRSVETLRKMVRELRREREFGRYQ